MSRFRTPAKCRSARRVLRHFAGYVDKPHGVSTGQRQRRRQTSSNTRPYGVVGVIARGTDPWWWPVPVSRRHWPRNAVVFKPSELAPLAALRFGELCLEAGPCHPGWSISLPAAADGGDALVQHPGSADPTSPAVSRPPDTVLRAAADSLTPVTPNSAASRPTSIFADADLDTAAALSAHRGHARTIPVRHSTPARILVRLCYGTHFAGSFSPSSAPIAYR